MVMGKVGDNLVADLLGSNRVGDDAAQAGNCTFLPFSSQLLPLVDVVVAPLSGMCASAETRTRARANPRLPGQLWALHADDTAMLHPPAACRAKLPSQFFSPSARDSEDWHGFADWQGEGAQEGEICLLDARARRVNSASVDAVRCMSLDHGNGDAATACCRRRLLIKSSRI